MLEMVDARQIFKIDKIRHFTVRLQVTAAINYNIVSF